ncbi:MAG: hypothetical protein MUE50_06660 [Pirellulaceae bacterium]|nr:hypothetical protein [Pirellulaceae bacterium]
MLQRIALLEARVAQMEQRAMQAANSVTPEPFVEDVPPPESFVENVPLTLLATPDMQPQKPAPHGNPYLRRRLEREQAEAPPELPPELEQAVDDRQWTVEPGDDRADRIQERVTENARRKAADRKIRMANTPLEYQKAVQEEMQRRYEWAMAQRPAQAPVPVPVQPLAQPPATPIPPPAPAALGDPQPQTPTPRISRPVMQRPADIPIVDETSLTGRTKPGGAVPSGPGTNDDEPTQTLGKNMVAFGNRVVGAVEEMARQLCDLGRRLEDVESAREMEYHE